MLNEYVPLTGDARPCFQIQGIYEKLGLHLNKRLTIHPLPESFPNQLQGPCDLIVPSLMNIVNNAESHGQKNGPIELITSYSREDDQNYLVLRVINRPGKNHKQMVELQSKQGKNFLFGGATYINSEIRKHGSDDSTFMVSEPY